MTTSPASPSISLVMRSRRDRWAVLAGVATVTVAAWTYILAQGSRMTGMSVGASDHPMMRAMHTPARVQPWTPGEIELRLLMWVVMMAAMMIPTAASMTLQYAAVARRAAFRSPVAPAFVFVGGYVAVWSVFAVVATLSQVALDDAGLLSPMMVSNSVVLGSGLLLAAGVYQLTTLKRACLGRCRASARFVSENWKAGTAGAFRMGARLGVFCLGCCWVLMGLLFVGGVMNPIWIAAIAVFILLERTIRAGTMAGRLAGVGLVLVGAIGLAV